MKLPPDFNRTLKAMSDDELCEMLISHRDYLPDAITRAREELDQRRIPVALAVRVGQNFRALRREPGTQGRRDWTASVLIHLLLLGGAALKKWLDWL